MTKLKPCPFCGGEAKIEHDWSVGNDGSAYFWATCNNRHCLVRPYSKEDFNSAEGAIEAWNTRADDAYGDDGK